MLYTSTLQISQSHFCPNVEMPHFSEIWQCVCVCVHGCIYTCIKYIQNLNITFYDWQQDMGKGKGNGKFIPVVN